ncbi:MAG: beta-glucosidase [Flavobacteriales bacterium]|jgi:beta-glucosidase
MNAFFRPIYYLISIPFLANCANQIGETPSNGVFSKNHTELQQHRSGLPPNDALSPVVQNADWAVEWWQPRHEQKLTAALTSDIDLLMIGDSITHGWESGGSQVWQEYYQHRKAFNLGFSGDRTEHVLWRLQHGAVKGLKPKLTVLMIGTNNTGHHMDPAEFTAKGIEAIVDELRTRLPESKILILGIFPRHYSPFNEMRRRNDAINSNISNLDNGVDIFYRNLNSVFLDNNGTLSESIMPDLLHPNAMGYRIWAEAMEPTIKALLE